MQLDDLKNAWVAHGDLLARSLAIDERLLREMFLRKVRRALLPYVLWLGVEVALGVGILFTVVPVLGHHLAEPRYLALAGALVVFVVAVIALTARLLVGTLRLDHGGPVTTMQGEVARLELAEYRTLKLALLGGIVLWLPALLLLAEAVTGVDALARVDAAWLVANVAFGLVALAVGQALSKRYLERNDRRPWARALLTALSGRGLRAAAAHLAELESFTRDA